jgi:hypothetical protein
MQNQSRRCAKGFLLITSHLALEKRAAVKPFYIQRRIENDMMKNSEMMKEIEKENVQ